LAFSATPLALLAPTLLLPNVKIDVPITAPEYVVVPSVVVAVGAVPRAPVIQSPSTTIAGFTCYNVLNYVVPSFLKVPAFIYTDLEPTVRIQVVSDIYQPPPELNVKLLSVKEVVLPVILNPADHISPSTSNQAGVALVPPITFNPAGAL